MKFILDTNICIFIIKQKPPDVMENFLKNAVGDIGISSITLAELEYGVAKSRFPEKNQTALMGFTLPLEVLSFDGKAAQVYGAVRAYLEKKGLPIGSLDALIGAHALSAGATLVTNNLREFKRIPKLKVVDWTTSGGS